MYIPKRSHSITHRIKNSRFIATAEPFDDLSGVKQRVEEIRGQNPGSAHVVYALSVGDEKNRSFAMSDDGEPKGTAGRPALEVLRGSGITDCLVSIVRYFGGTKLGTGGLVRAYGGATKAALESLPVKELIDTLDFSLETPYEHHEPVQRALSGLGAEITDEQFGEKVTMYGRVAREAFAACAEAVRETSRGTVTLVAPEQTESEDKDET